MGLLRFSLALCVLFTHLHGISILGMRFGDGMLAVQCFYMISGFYMALVLNEKYTGPGSYQLFMEQRYLRLFPTYFTVLLITLAGEAFLHTPGSTSNWGLDYWLKYGGRLTWPTVAALGFSNLTLLGLDVCSMFTALNPQTGNLYPTSAIQSVPVPSYSFTIVGPAWTIGLELLFYIAAPFLVRKSAVFQGSAVLLSFGLRLGFAHFLNLSHDSWSYRFFFFEIGVFLLGSLAYRFYRNHAAMLQRGAHLFPGLRWVLLFLWAFYTRLPFSGDTRYFIFAVGTLLLLPYLFLMTKDRTYDRLLGELSYPMYMVHWSVILLIEPWIYRMPHYLSGIVYVGLVVLAAWLIYRFIEHPLDNFRHRLFFRQKQRLAKSWRPVSTQRGLGERRAIP